MHVLFVHAALGGTPFNCSIAALSAYVKQAGLTTSLALVHPDDSAQQVREKLSGPADIIAFSFMTCQAEWVAELMRTARAVQPQARLIAGGAYPTTYPFKTLESHPVDAVCVGEGEKPFLDWIQDDKRHNLGIIRSHSSDAITRWKMTELDRLPDWDRALFPTVHNSGNRYEEAVGIAFSRGFCPFSCTFCGIDGYRRINNQPLKGAVRMRTARRVLDEMARLVDSMDCSAGFAVWDEVLPTKRAWFEPFAKQYRQEIGLPLAAHARIEQIKPWVVDSLVEAGCDYMVIGLECGDEKYRARVLNKPFSNAQAIDAITKLEDAGVQTYISFMLGLPLETPRMLASTVRLAAQLPKTSEIEWRYYTPERGTRLFDLLVQHDLVIDRFVDSPFGGSEPQIKLTRCTTHDLDLAIRGLEMLR